MSRIDLFFILSAHEANQTSRSKRGTDWEGCRNTWPSCLAELHQGLHFINIRLLVLLCWHHNVRTTPTHCQVPNNCQSVHSSCTSIQPGTASTSCIDGIRRRMNVPAHRKQAEHDHLPNYYFISYHTLVQLQWLAWGWTENSKCKI